MQDFGSNGDQKKVFFELVWHKYLIFCMKNCWGLNIVVDLYKDCSKIDPDIGTDRNLGITYSL